MVGSRASAARQTRRGRRIGRGQRPEVRGVVRGRLPGRFAWALVAAAAAVFRPSRPLFVARCRLQSHGRRRLVAAAARPGRWGEASSAWAVLDLPPGTEKVDVRKRFRKLAKTEHPDKRPGDPKAAEKFARIAQAYEELMSDEPDFGSQAADPRWAAADFARRYSDFGGGPAAGGGPIPVDEAEARFKASQAAQAAQGASSGFAAGQQRRGASDGNALEFVGLGSLLIVAAAFLYSVLNAAYCAATNDWWCSDPGLPLDVLYPDP